MSDHSAVNYIHQVVLRLLKTSNLQFQIRLLSEVGVEEIKLLTSYAGHESLWYQRRLFSTTFFSWIFQNSWLNLCHSDIAQYSSQLVSSIQDLSNMIREYSGERNIQRFQVDNYDVNIYLTSENNFFENIQNYLNLNNVQDEMSSSSREWAPLIACIYKYISLEINLVLALLTDDMSWNPELQLKFSFRYLYYLLFSVSFSFISF